MKVLENYPYVLYGNELTTRMQDARQAALPWDFVAFTSREIPEVGSAIRFYGGTPATGITPCAPSLAFDIYGNCEVMIGEWMNRENCPNAFDPAFIRKVAKFVQENLPVFFLLHSGKLPPEIAMDYFAGKVSWDIMLTGIRDVPDDLYLWLQYAADPFDLHKRAFDAGLYQKRCPEAPREIFADSVCPLLKTFGREQFELDLWGDEWYLAKYNGYAAHVAIPEDYAVIGEESFVGHTEIQKVRLHNGCIGIDAQAFAGCTNLREINFPDVCDWIGAKAFAECTNLRIGSLPPRVSIGEGAFHKCTSLQELLIPEEVTEIGKDAFLGCPGLVILCKENSCAHIYAQENGIPCRLQV